MAIAKTKYECSLCGNVYDSLDEAEECELCHKLPGKVGESRYFNGEVYPRTVTLWFDEVPVKYMRGVI